jgi:hypothetical protein
MPSTNSFPVQLANTIPRRVAQRTIGMLRDWEVLVVDALVQQRYLGSKTKMTAV